jgi:hypothetical protein
MAQVIVGQCSFFSDMKNVVFSFDYPTWATHGLTSHTMLLDRIESVTGFHPCSHPTWADFAFGDGTKGLVGKLQDHDMCGNVKVKLYFIKFSEEEADEVKTKL